MKLSVVIFALLPGIAAADGWQRLLDDTAITEALAGQVVVYDAYTRQYFGPNGATQYFTERASDGRWAARAGQYCSVWPPSDTWACYDLEINGNQVRFTSADRSQSVGAFAE